MHTNLTGSIPSPLGQDAPDTSLRVDAAARGCAISFLTSDSSASPDCFLSFFFGIYNPGWHDCPKEGSSLSDGSGVLSRFSKNGYVPFCTVLFSCWFSPGVQSG